MAVLIVHGAVRAGGTPPGQDRWAATENAAIVLDGASSYTPAAVNATQYVSELVAVLEAQLKQSGPDLRSELREAIKDVAAKLDLEPSFAPSSTVLIARQRGGILELLALGDSTAIVGTTDGQLCRVTDSRLSEVAPEVRAAYRDRLRDGGGYGESHRALLAELQRAEVKVRNTPDGYWIAEADERAADEAITATFDLDAVEFCVLATDGAQRPIDHLGIAWGDVARRTATELDELLTRLHDWEESQDPDGVLLPRAKRHDDKAIVVCRPSLVRPTL